MIVNPVRYGKGNKLTTVTAKGIGALSVYFTTNGEWNTRDRGGEFEADAGSICIISGGSTMAPTVTGMARKATISSKVHAYQVDA